MMTTAPTRRAKPSEEGFILVAVMFLLALIIIALMVAAPKIAADIQRDREIETYHRGMQYRRAVQLYFKKFQRYPPNLDALVKTNNLRFLRKKYIDPITGKDDWKPIMMGQNKAPLAMGFFGQPLVGMGFGGGVLAGMGQGGVGGVGTTIGSGAFNPGGGGSDPNANPNDPSNTGNAGANPTDPNAGAGAGGSQITGANPVGGQAFGGAGIVGFSPASPKPSILVYKKKTHYNEWEFTYSPASEMGGLQSAPAQLLGGQAPGTGGLQNPPTPQGPQAPQAPQ